MIGNHHINKPQIFKRRLTLEVPHDALPTTIYAQAPPTNRISGSPRNGLSIPASPSVPIILPPAPLTPFLSPAPPTPLLFVKKGGVSLRFSDFLENTEQGFLPSQSDKARVFLIFRIGRFWMKFRGIQPQAVSLIDFSCAAVSAVSVCSLLLFVFVCAFLCLVFPLAGPCFSGLFLSSDAFHQIQIQVQIHIQIHDLGPPIPRFARPNLRSSAQIIDLGAESKA